MGVFRMITTIAYLGVFVFGVAIGMFVACLCRAGRSDEGGGSK
jgi:hypothetical protein